MDPSRKSATRAIVLAADGVIIVVSMVAAFVLHGVLRGVLPLLKAPPGFSEYALLACLAIPLWLVLITAVELDRCFEKPWRWTETTIDLVKVHVFGLIGVTVLLFLTQSVVNRSMVGMFLACSFCLMLLERGLIGWWLDYQHESGQGRLRILLVGDAWSKMADFIEEALHDPLPPRFIGYVSGKGGPVAVASGLPLAESLPHLGTIDDLERVLHDQAVDHVLFFPPFDRPEAVPQALRASETVGVPASFPIRLERLFAAKPRVRVLFGNPFVTFEMSPQTPSGLAVKQAVDFTLALVCIVLLSPLFLLSAVAILVTMGCPILFTQERAGIYGRRFRMLKFRTMKRGAETERLGLLARNEMSGPVFKVTDDPRVTPLGRWLRKLSIDELPQLANVLLGSMSLVGPRPLPVEEQQGIRGWHRRRLSMKPGITGLWQVSGRSNVDFEEWMKLDLRYIDEWSLRVDAWILLKTIPSVLLGSGSR